MGVSAPRHTPEAEMGATLPDMTCSEHYGDSCANAGVDLHPVYWLQAITVLWMLVECVASLYAAAKAHSLALFVFGSDSLVELLSAAVALLQFVPRIALDKSLAERAAGILLYLLAGTVVGIGFLHWNAPKETSYLGITVTVAALIVMPVLAWMKRRQAGKLDNRTLAADATQSATCAYLAAVTLAGLSAYAIWHITWIDTVAALAAVPIVIIEGRRAWRGEGCGCA